VTTATQAGITDHVWDLADLLTYLFVQHSIAEAL
jgi:hypothetical protein